MDFLASFFSARRQSQCSKCSYQVQTGDQRYTVYELRTNLTQQEYTLELLSFCLQTRNRSLDDLPDRLEDIAADGFSEWAYDDRLYERPHVQDLAEHEYRVLERYLR